MGDCCGKSPPMVGGSSRDRRLEGHFNLKASVATERPLAHSLQNTKVEDGKAH